MFWVWSLDHTVLNLPKPPVGVGREQFKFGFQNLTFKLFSALMTRMLRIQFVMYRIHENKSNLLIREHRKVI